MPLFPIVWQYQNQTIQTLAADVAELVVNTNLHIPVSNGTAFVDSPIFVNGSVMRTLFNGTNPWNGLLEGFMIDASNKNYKFGAIEGGTNASDLEITDSIGEVKLTSNWQGVWETTWGLRSDIRTLFANGVAAPLSTATISTTCLKVKVDGVSYRIPLYQ